jgi:IMP dehydrogenase
MDKLDYSIETKTNSYIPDFKVIDFPIGLTFDDVLLVPQYSEIDSRQQCDVRSRFSKNVPLKIPIVSSPMDTVTEDQMAREMAMQGGIGIIHRFCTIKEQASMVK